MKFNINDKTRAKSRSVENESSNHAAFDYVKTTLEKMSKVLNGTLSANPFDDMNLVAQFVINIKSTPPKIFQLESSDSINYELIELSAFSGGTLIGEFEIIPEM